MAERLGTAELLLTADPKPLQAGLRQAEQSAQQTTQKIGEQFTRTGRKIETAANGFQYFLDAQGRARQLNGQYATTAQQAAAGLDKLAGSARSAGGGIPPLAGNIANLAAQLGLAVSAAEVLRYTFNQLTQIEDAGAAVRTLGVDSEALRANLSKLSDELGANVSTLDLLKASYDVASSGFADAASATDILRAAAAGARGGFADINEVAKATTAVLNAYGLSSAEAARVVDGFVQAQADGVLTVKQYADNVGEIVSVAAAAGISIEELNAAIATATLKGVQVNQAFTGFRQVISSILKPSAEATKLANQLGIDFSLAGLQAKGFSGFLSDVALKTGASADKVAILLGSVEAQAALQPLLNDQLAKYNELLGKQANKTGAAAKSADTASATISSGITKISNRLSNLAIELDQGIGKELDDIISKSEKALGLLARVLRAVPKPGQANGVTAEANNAFRGLLGGDPRAFLNIAERAYRLGQQLGRGLIPQSQPTAQPGAQQQQGPARFPTSTAAESEAFFERIRVEQEAARQLAKEQEKAGKTVEESIRRAADRLKDAAALVKSSAEALSSARSGFADAVGQAFAIATNEQRARARAINERSIRMAEQDRVFDPARVAYRYGLRMEGGQLQLQNLTFRQLERLAKEVSTLGNAEQNLQTAMSENTTALKALAARKWEVQVNVRQNLGGDMAVNTINNLR